MFLKSFASSGNTMMLLTAGISTFAMAATSTGSIIETDASSTVGFTVATRGDVLLHNNHTTYSGGTYSSTFGIYTSVLFDGVAPANPVPTPSVNEEFIPHDGTILTVPLATATTLGSLITYTGWRDHGRVNQNYTVAYSTDNGSTYTNLDTVAYAYSLGTAAPADTEVQLALSTPLVHVTDLQFSFANVQNNGVGYTELAAYAPTSVPEPVSLGLVTLGGLGLLLIKRRRKE